MNQEEALKSIAEKRSAFSLNLFNDLAAGGADTCLISIAAEHFTMACAALVRSTYSMAGFDLKLTSLEEARKQIEEADKQ